MKKQEIVERATKIVNSPIRFYYHETFKTPKKVLIEIPDKVEYDKESIRILELGKGVEVESRPLYAGPILTREQEFHLFRKMNYFKYRANKLADKMNPKTVGEKKVIEIEAYLEKANQVKTQIANSNFRLALLVKKLGSNIEDCYYDILKAIDYFDYNLGNKFSTYATWVMKNNHFTRRGASLAKESHFISVASEFFDGIHCNDNGHQDELQKKESKEVARKLLKRMGNKKNYRRELFVVRNTFGVGCEKRTLHDVGNELHISKERVRQLRERGIVALQKIANDNKIVCES